MLGVVLLTVIFSALVPWTLVIPVLSFVGFFVCIVYAGEYVFWVKLDGFANERKRLAVEPPLVRLNILRRLQKFKDKLDSKENGIEPLNVMRKPLEEIIAQLMHDVTRKELADPLFKMLQNSFIPTSSAAGQQKLRTNKHQNNIENGIEEVRSNFTRTILSPKIFKASDFLAWWYREQKRGGMEQQLWVNLLNAIQNHVKQYKRMRREIMRESQPPSNKKIISQLTEESFEKNKLSEFYRHLDDYNEVQDDNPDGNWESGPPPAEGYMSEISSLTTCSRNSIDDINSQIVTRMISTGLLHPAVTAPGKEMEHLRGIIDKIWSLLDHTSGRLNRARSAEVKDASNEEHPGLHTSNSLLRVLFREWIVSQFLSPFIHTVSQPDYLNMRLLQQAHKRAVQQKAVKSFRSFIQIQFIRFPPPFINNIEMLVKYSKKARSVIDIKAIRYLVVYQLRKRLDQIKDNSGSPEEEEISRQIKNLDVLRVKFEKRLSTVAGTGNAESKTLHDRIMKNFSGQPVLSPQESRITSMVGNSNPPLTLRSCLEDYLDAEKKEIENTTSFYFFMAFLEKRGDQKRDSSRVRFWMATEKYRRLVNDLRTTITSIGWEKQSTLNGEVVGGIERLRKEATRIYDQFLSGNNPALELGDNILLNAIEYFVQGPASSRSEESLKQNEDYKCILVAQNLIEKELDVHLFQEFLHSEWYFKWTSEVQKHFLSGASGAMNSEMMGGSTSEFLKPLKRFDDPSWISGFSTDERFSLDGESDVKEPQNSLLLQRLYQEIELNASRVSQSQNRSPESNVGKALGDNDFSPSSANFDGKSMDLPKDIFLVEEDQDFHVPGELLVKATKLQRTKEDIDKVMLQMDCLGYLTNMVQERHRFGSTTAASQLFIIERTKEAMRQEIGDLMRQKTRLESQDMRDAIVPGQCTVAIVEAFEGDVRGGDDTIKGSKNNVTFYSIEIKKPDHPGWKVSKRYSDFHSLHRQLRSKFEWINDLELPGKAIGLFNKRTEFKAARMVALEKYLQRLLDNEKVCQSDELRSFLSTSFQLTRRSGHVNRKSDDADKVFDGKKSNRLSRLLNIKRGHNSVPARQKTGRNRRRRRNQVQSESPISSADEDENASKSTYRDKSTEARAGSRPNSPLPDAEDFEEELEDDEDETWGDSESDSESVAEPAQFQSNPLAEPLCLILTELYDFKEQTSWLRRNAAVLLLKELLGGKDSLGSQLTVFLNERFSEEAVVRYLIYLRERITVHRNLSPGSNSQPSESMKKKNQLAEPDPVGSAGKSSMGAETPQTLFSRLFEEYIPRSQQEQFQTRTEARSLISSALPDAFLRNLGNEAAVQGTCRLFDIFQNPTLNKHLLFTLLDSFLATAIQSDMWS